MAKVAVEQQAETDIGVDIGVIQGSMQESLLEFYGRGDLKWVDCLFRQLRENGISGGDIDPESFPTPVKDRMNGRGFFRHSFGRKAILYTPSWEGMPKDFDIYVQGAEHNDRALEIICVSPRIIPVDYQSRKVLERVHLRAQEQVKAKHLSVEGRIVLPEESRGYPIAVVKRFQPPIETPFHFWDDLNDIAIIARAYQNFRRDQSKRSREASNLGDDLFEAAREI